MALCFAHTAAGYLAYEAVRPAGPHRPWLLAAGVALANAADLDFVPGILLGQPGLYHRGLTHTVGALVLVAAAVAMALRLAGWRRGAWLGASLWAGAAYASHLMLDYLTIDAVPPYGGRFLWPFSDAYYLAPVTLLPEIIIDPSGRMAFLRSLVARHAGLVWLRDVGLLALTVGAVHALRGRQAVIAWRDVPEGP
jgi:inner membrane protein